MDGSNRDSRESAPHRVGSVGVYTSNPPGPVNTWWIETGEGLVLIDAQRTNHEARLAIEAIRATGWPVQAILITHSHSDHVGGLPMFVDAFGSDIPVYADAVTIEQLRTDPLNDIAFTKLYIGPDFPDALFIPNHVLEDGQVLSFGELEIVCRLLGPGEAPSMTMFHVPDANALFIGDLATNQHTPWLADGHTSEWLKKLAEQRRAYPEETAVYPGHGVAGTLALLDEDAAYIRAFRDAVATYGDGKSELDANAMAELTVTLSERFPPNYAGRPAVAAMTNPIEFNIEMIARELGRRPGQPGMLPSAPPLKQ